MSHPGSRRSANCSRSALSSAWRTCSPTRPTASSLIPPPRRPAVASVSALGSSPRTNGTSARLAGATAAPISYRTSGHRPVRRACPADARDSGEAGPGGGMRLGKSEEERRGGEGRRRGGRAIPPAGSSAASMACIPGRPRRSARATVVQGFFEIQLEVGVSRRGVGWGSADWEESAPPPHTDVLRCDRGGRLALRARWILLHADW